MKLRWPTPQEIAKRQRPGTNEHGRGGPHDRPPRPKRARFTGPPPPPGHVELASDTGAHIVVFRTGPIDHQGGVGGWVESDRVGQANASWYDGPPVEVISFPCLIDVDLIPGPSIARRLRTLYRMGNPTGNRDQPPGIIIRGAAPAVRGTRWKLDDLGLGADLEEVVRGNHVVRRIEFAMTLSELDPVAEVERVRVKRSRDQKGRRKKRHYTVRQGDTLRTIAVRELGASSAWSALRAENKKRLGKHADPDTPLRKGMRLELP